MAQCPICLEIFKEDEAYIPDLECLCAIIVHLDCWIPWSGGCLYCRETPITDYEEFVLPPIVEEPQNNQYIILYYNPHEILCVLALCIVLYFYIIIKFI
jgi:hypothetical protein